MYVGQGRISRVSAAPLSHGADPTHDDFWAPPAPKRFDLQRRKLARKHMWGSSVFLGGKRPIPTGRGPSVPPQKNGTHSYAQFNVEQRNLVWQYVWGTSVFLWRQPPSAPKGAEPHRFQKFWSSYMRAHSTRNKDQILHDDQTTREYGMIYYGLRRKSVFFIVDHE